MAKEEEEKKDTGKALEAEVVESKAIASRELTGPQMMERMVMMDEKRKAFTKFVKNQIVKNEHSYKIDGSAKDSLSKSGGLLLCGFYGVRPAYDKTETHGPNGEYTVVSVCKLYSLRDDSLQAEGQGSCTTQEDKYRWRWLTANKMPKVVDKSLLMTKKLKNKKTGEWFELFRMANEELWSLHNTVLKMSMKRALVAAALNLPFASEVFTQDLEENIHPAQEEKKGDTPADEPLAQGGEQPPAAGDEPVSGAMQRMIHAKFRWLATSDEDRKRLLKEWYPNSGGHVWDDKTSKGLSKKEGSELIDTFTKDPDLIKNALKSFKDEKK